MGLERKSIMISARLPSPLVDRVNYVVNNSPVKAVSSRTDVVQAALEAWLPAQEEKIGGLLGSSVAKKAGQ